MLAWKGRGNVKLSRLMQIQFLPHQLTHSSSGAAEGKIIVKAEQRRHAVSQPWCERRSTPD
ncbi:hypothetical protein T4A_9616 [Trichinella pseudospiralis]|uniref:Uncharacterized protein n=1 Tax=Trichinella pseudospiralis TaxID=6337 RepID=A0A0V1JX11_TRIPS|nr:hypothetical protein T4E_11942 [Trichinella pseudospiralis]KRY79850.1 hypothetical protein T4A_9616 [Trichinella pseudospiralis]KRY88123.1 hypothetical protein T4D_3957 [Trichinella pseudospiralis]KRZ39522.1 hypothetical protein T4C_7946 [Trichinella pseudospiralis]